MINWLSTLPQSFLLNGFAEQSSDNLIASQNSVGPAKIRQRSTSTPYMLAGSMVFTPAQKSDFKTFVVGTIASGAKAFNFPNPDGGEPLLVRLKPGYTFSYIGNNWKVSLEFEVLP